MRRLYLYKPLYMILLPVVVVLFIIIIVLIYSVIGDYEREQHINGQLLTSLSEIRYFDEALTLAANMFVLTGESKWEQRYNDTANGLDHAIHIAVALYPASQPYLDDIRTANYHMIVLEKQSMALVRAGRQADAQAILLSEEYQQDKVRYAEGLSLFLAALQDKQNIHETEMRGRLRFSLNAILVFFLTIMFILLYTFRLLARRLEIENTISLVSRQLLSQESDTIDEQIQWLMALLADKANAGYICLIHRSGDTVIRVWHHCTLTSPHKNMAAELCDISIAIESADSGVVDWPYLRWQSDHDHPEKQKLKQLGVGSYFCISTLGSGAEQLQLSLASTHYRLGVNQADQPVLNSILEIASQSIRQQIHKHNLFELATTDALTGVNSRRYFLEQLQQVIDQQKRFSGSASLLMLDIDRFKRINDTYGHAVGDVVLIRFAEIVKSCLREIDVLGRLGGEEFAVILPHTAAAGAAISAERIRQAIENECVVADAAAIRFTVSIGATIIDSADKQPDVPLKRVDSALYMAKEAGRNQVKFLL